MWETLRCVTYAFISSVIGARYDISIQTALMEQQSAQTCMYKESVEKYHKTSRNTTVLVLLLQYICCLC